jgi:hypothetical protein
VIEGGWVRGSSRILFYRRDVATHSFAYHDGRIFSSVDTLMLCSGWGLSFNLVSAALLPFPFVNQAMVLT